MPSLDGWTIGKTVESNCFLTVFTPTFNRAHLLPSVYSSLLAQKDNNFEWIIVDDGSTDGTKALVTSWIQKSDFPIRYIHQQNSGKHVAINRGVSAARGMLFVIVDSDDQLAPGALKSIREAWLSIPEGSRRAYAGVMGLCAFKDGRLVGTPFPRDNLVTNSVELRSRYRVKGDKFDVYRVDLLREFRFPENMGTFVTEGLVWNRVARKYRILCKNTIWAIIEYHPDGLSANSVLLRAENPIAACTYYGELLDWTGGGITLLYRLRAAANYDRFSMHRGEFWPFFWGTWTRRLTCAIAWPLGALLYLRDRVIIWFHRRVRA